MDTRAWRRWVLVLSAATIAAAVFALMQWNVHYPRPEALGALAALGLGIGIIAGGAALTADRAEE